ncbi:hypothetical protein K491DRAFT_729100 [Lophiostoma macrostomum CBS 122681]|uniref:Uncharacterized protein n=1 Tax=Lophiostoma macrostomum CBS 122681 TaxID=1314788 RepID=A0A6A6SUY2_9PLEO|nr:hypothetical protein K491DRAFT_729100 [Lophiostoma macrostomum CBS 122681]
MSTRHFLYVLFPYVSPIVYSQYAENENEQTSSKQYLDGLYKHNVRSMIYLFNFVYDPKKYLKTRFNQFNFIPGAHLPTYHSARSPQYKASYKRCTQTNSNMPLRIPSTIRDQSQKGSSNVQCTTETTNELGTIAEGGWFNRTANNLPDRFWSSAGRWVLIALIGMLKFPPLHFILAVYVVHPWCLNYFGRGPFNRNIQLTHLERMKMAIYHNCLKDTLVVMSIVVYGCLFAVPRLWNAFKPKPTSKSSANTQRQFPPSDIRYYARSTHSSAAAGVSSSSAPSQLTYRSNVPSAHTLIFSTVTTVVDIAPGPISPASGTQDENTNTEHEAIN